jgi:homoserine dehydrogenase
VIILTQTVVEKSMDDAIAEVEALASVSDSVMRIRVESLSS